MSNDALNWAVSQRVTPSQKLVLLVLANRADGDWRCWPSAKKLAEESSLSDSSVLRAVKELIKAGLINVSYDSGKRNVYTLTPFTVTPPSEGHPRHCDTPVTVTPPSHRRVTPVTVTPHPRHCDAPTRASTDEPKEEPKENPKRERARGEAPQKLPFGENAKVRLTQAQHDNLCEKFGKELTQKAIALLDLHIGAKGKDPYADHNLALQKWVFDAVKEREAKQAARASPQTLGQRRLHNNIAAMQEFINDGTIGAGP